MEQTDVTLTADERIQALEAGVRRLMDVGDEMGIYPAAVSGLNDQRDYKERDGYKNGWNAAVMIYGRALDDVLYKLGVTPNRLYGDDPPLETCPLCERKFE